MKKTGTIIAVVGPSGAGKDTLIDHARKALVDDGQFVFVKRCITRPASAGGEAHEEVSESGFAQMAAEGNFALWWRAHGLFYGIPASTFSDLEKGRILIVNGSRSALPALRETYGAALKIALVTAPKPILAARLAARGRETAESVLKRLERTVDQASVIDAAIEISNDGPAERAGQVFLEFLRQLGDGCRESLSREARL